MKLFNLLIVLSGLFSPLFAPTGPTIVVIGEISDSQCVFDIHSRDGSHAAMIKTDTLGKSAEECTRTCVRMGGQYILADTVNDKLYRLANPALAINFAGKRVRVRGVTDNKDIFSITDIENR